MASELHDSRQGCDRPAPAGRAVAAFTLAFLATLGMVALLLVYPPLAVTLAAVGFTWWWWTSC